MSDLALDGAVALVTGASCGTGAAIARRLALQGAAVALVGTHRDRLDRAGIGIPIEADITDPVEADDVVQRTLDRLGRLDILVNNAGIMLLNSALHTTVEDWDRMVSLNVAALLHITHAAIPYLIDAAATSPRQVADLVNVGSTAGRLARPGRSVYNLTQFGLRGFTESLRQELLAEHVRVSVVSPGEALDASDIADAISYIVTRERRVAVNEMLVRAGHLH
ncbi:SDR family NAD(P)-dependent oxidoreductase [Actinoplanes sp. NPDC051343]|uniref:SDR family NAD(P)-dependent oxidoreductase n=1 Tax=Actinoplanes sp. NPDC051343 TaxID=3363906 RepID=UPI0037904C31